MTEEQLLKKIQQKKLEERQRTYEDKKKYRKCLLKCVDVSSSSLTRRLIFIEEYFPIKTSLFLLFFCIFSLGLMGFLTTSASLLHSMCFIVAFLSANVCVFVVYVINEDLPFLGFTDEGIYEAVRWVNKEIESFESNKLSSLEGEL